MTIFLAAQLIAILASLISIPIIRAYIRQRLPHINDLQFDITRIIMLLLAISVGTVKFLQERASKNKFEETFLAAREYQSVAQLNTLGTDTHYDAGSTIITQTKIEREMKKSFTKASANAWTTNCHNEELDQLLFVATKWPKFPFSHYCLAQCLRKIGEPSWTQHAQRALFHLEHTTLIAHHPDHDKAKSELLEALSKGK